MATTTFTSNRVLGIALTGIFFAIGCGGSSSSDDTPPFSGVWYGNASLVEDSCGVITDQQQFIYFTHLVNQNDAEVILDNGFSVFTGAAQSESSFLVETVKQREPINGKNGCSETITFRYEGISDTQAQFVVRSSEINCGTGADTFSCKFAFTGNAYRPIPPGGDEPVPIPVIEDSGTATIGFEGSIPDSVDSNATSESSL
jgi:hypothetical protein